MERLRRTVVGLWVVAWMAAGCMGQGAAFSTSASPTEARTVVASIEPTATTEAVAANATAVLAPTLSTIATPEPLHLQPSAILSGLTGPDTIIAWSPDGATLASASGGFNAFQSADHDIRLWSKDGSLRATLTGHSGTLSALAWSPDGQTLASSSYDGTARLWSAAGEARRTLSGGKQPMHNLAWSPDGRLLATGAIGSIPPATLGCCATFPGIVRLWHADGAFSLTLGTRYTGGKFFNLAWSPDGKMLAGGATDYRIWRADGTLLGETPGCNSCTPAWGMAWSPDSQTLATGNENGELFVYDTTGHRSAVFAKLSGGIDELSFAPDGKLLASGSTSQGVQLLRSADLQTVVFLAAPARPPVRWSADGALIATGSLNTGARIFHTSGEALRILDGCAGTVRAVAWSPDGRTLAAGTSEDRVCMWSMPAGFR